MQKAGFLTTRLIWFNRKTGKQLFQEISKRIVQTHRIVLLTDFNATKWREAVGLPEENKQKFKLAHVSLFALWKYRSLAVN